MSCRQLELRGATAFVTADLEDLLIKFVVFLRTSKSSTKPIVDVTYNFSLSFMGLVTNKSGAVKARSSGASRSGVSASISAAGIGADVRVSDITQDPINSNESQARFERDAYRLSVPVKEVTLGSGPIDYRGAA